MEPFQPHATARRAMVQRQLMRRGIRDERVLDAMDRVPRDRFVPPSSIDHAYDDRALSIDCGQTISQPYIVALMTEALKLTGSEHVLEIGTGSGYQTALLCELAHDVVSIERHEPLSRSAAAVLKRLGYHNVRLRISDGTQGYPPDAPFDRIIVTAGGPRVPPALFEQLCNNGLLVMPVGASENQLLQVIHKLDNRPQTVTLTACRFVPLIADPPPEPGHRKDNAS